MGIYVYTILYIYMVFNRNTIGYTVYLSWLQTWDISPWYFIEWNITSYNYIHYNLYIIIMIALIIIVKTKTWL